MHNLLCQISSGFCLPKIVKKNLLIFNGVIQETAGQRFWTTAYNDLRCECIDGHDGAYLCVFRQLTRISFLLDSSSWDSTETSVFLRIKKVKWSFLSPWYRETFSRVASGEIGSWDTSWRSSTSFACCKLRSAEFGGVWLRTGSTWAQGHYGTLIGSHILLVDRYYRHAP